MRRVKAQVSPGRLHVIGMLCLLVHGTGASCIAGKEPRPSSGSCAKCSPGTFKAAAGTEACASCPINSFSASGRAEDLADATASISPATTSVGGDEISGLALSPTSDILYMSIRQKSHIKRIYVSGASGSQTSDAELIAGSRFGLRGSNDGVGTRAQFKLPGDVAIANDGRALFVADTENHVIRKILLTPEGGPEQYATSSLGRAGLQGSIDGTMDSLPACRFAYPTSVAMHQDGTVFVLEKAHGRVRIVSTDFTAVTSLGGVVGLQNARRILFTPSYDSFIVASSAIPFVFGSSDDRLMEVRISDSFRLKNLGGTPENRDGVGMAEPRFYQPTAMAWTPEGALLVSQYDGAIRIVNWDAETVMTLVAPPTAGITNFEALAYKPMHGGSTNTSGLYAGVSNGNDNDEVQLVRWELNSGAVACQACPGETTTQAAAAKSVEECTKRITTSTTPSPSATASTTAATTTPPPQELDTTLTPEVISQVQTAVATVVAGAVATSVVTSVVMSASGASSGASSGSGSMSAVNQVQMLSQVGRMGGSRSSSALSTASCGFGWSNYNPSNLGTDGFLGRNAPEYCANFTKATESSCNKANPTLNTARRAEIPPECQEQCGWDSVAPSLEQLLMCALCLVLVSVARTVISAILVHCFRQEPSTSMEFPMWEFMAISESLIRLIGLECPVIQGGAALLLAAGPVTFMSYTAYRLFNNKRRGELEYEPAEWPSWGACKEAMAGAKWYGKLYALYDYLGALKIRGGWNDGNTAGRHWGFLVGDFTTFAYLFCVWLMIKKILLLTTMEHLDGEVNAGSALTLQILDVVMLVVLLPFNDMQVTFVEVLAGITNSLAYFSIALPILGWNIPGFELPEVFQLLLASCGAAMAGISSFCGSIIKLVKAFLIFGGALKIPDLAGAGGLVAGFLADEALGRMQDQLKTGNTGDEEGDEVLDKDDEGRMMLELDVDYDAIGDEQEFGDEVCQDVARAAGLDIEAGEVRIVEICKAPDPKTGVLVYLAISNGDESKLAVQQAVESAHADTNLSMMLDMAYGDVEGKEEEFKKEVARDVSSSLDADEGKIHVLGLAPGSVWVHLKIGEGASPAHQSPSAAREELQRQASDPESKLRASKHAKHIKLLTSPETIKAQGKSSSKRDEVMKNLKEQLGDKNSLLRTGRHTSRAVRIEASSGLAHVATVAGYDTGANCIDKHGAHAAHDHADTHVVHVDAHLVHWSKSFFDERAAMRARDAAVRGEERVDKEGKSKSVGVIISARDVDMFEQMASNADASCYQDLPSYNSRLAALLLHSPIPVPADTRAYSPDLPTAAAERPYRPEFRPSFTRERLDGSSARQIPLQTIPRANPPKTNLSQAQTPDWQLAECDKKDLLMSALRPPIAALHSFEDMMQLSFRADPQAIRTPELPRRPVTLLDEKGQKLFSL